MAIKARPGENLDSMLRRFKKEVVKGGIIQDVRKHEYYISPSEKRRLKAAAAQKKRKKTEKKKLY